MLKEKVIALIQTIDDNELLLYILVFLEDTLEMDASDVPIV